MFILDATTKSLEVKLAGAHATTAPVFVTSYVDVTTTTYTPGEQDGLLNGTTAVTAMSAPGASTQRQLKLLTVRNQDTASVTLTLQYNNNATIRPIWKGALAVDDTLVYTDGEGLRVIDASGQVKTSATGGGSSGHVILEEGGAGLTARPNLNFVGAAITATDNPGGNATNVTLSQSPASASVVGTGRSVATTAPLSGGGDLSADRTLTTSMATNKLIGRGTAATGVMEEITLGTNLSFAATTLNASSGDSTRKGTEASRPTVANDGDVYYATDGLRIHRDNGSTYETWGPIFPLTQPVSGDFSWVNQGTATVDTTYGGIYLLAAGVTGDDIKIRIKTAPSTPYTVTAVMIGYTVAANYAGYGPCWRQSSDGKLVRFEIGNNNGPKLLVHKDNSPTSYSAQYTSTSLQEPLVLNGGLLHLRIADNGTNRICSYSFDGRHFRTLHTVGRTDFMTADQIGFYVNAQNANSEDVGNWLISWTEA